MKKPAFILLVIAFVTSACLPSSEDVTPASQVTVTLSPPTATETSAMPTHTATPVAKTVAVTSGLKLEIGEPGKNGLSEVENFTLPYNLTTEQKAEKEYQMDATTFGFAPGETALMYDNETGKLVIVSVGNPDIVIAKWELSETTTRAEMIYDYSMLVDENGENILLKVGFIEKMSSGVPKDEEDSISRDQTVYDYWRMNDAFSNGNRSGTTGPINIFSMNRRNAVLGWFLAQDPGEKPPQEVDKTEGVLYFLLNSGKVSKIVLINFVGEYRLSKITLK